MTQLTRADVVANFRGYRLSDGIFAEHRLPNLESFFADVRCAFRGLRKNPGFTAAAVTMLALGIGANAAVFTVTKAALFAGFPLVVENDRLAYISHRGCCVSHPDFEDWRSQAKSFEGMALVHGVQRTLSDESGLSETYDVTEITADTFTLVGQRPILGRDFAPSDETPGAAPVAILSHGFWERRYGAITISFSIARERVLA